MIENRLSKIASEENGIYNFSEGKAVFTDGSRSPDNLHQIQFNYQECLIDIKIDIGVVNSVIVVCILSSDIRPIDFRIDSISHFENLFFNRKSRFKVECDNSNFKYFLENKALNIFEDISHSESFEPNIYTDNELTNKKIIIEFAICFPCWLTAIEKTNEFMKTVIRELKSDNRFISNTIYRQKD